MLPIDRWSHFRNSEDGAVAVIVSLMLTMLIGFVALGVDVASLYRDRARLQVATDMTALSAMADTEDATARAQDAALNNDRTAETITSLQLGRFLRNPAIAPAERFTPLDASDPRINAVQVVLTDDSPLHFAKVFSDKTEVTMDRTALATRTGAASFALDSYIARLDPITLNRLTEQDFGVAAVIGLGDMTLLADTQISLGDVLSLLEETAGVSGNPADILNAVLAMDDVIGAIRAQLSPALAQSLAGLEAAASGVTVDVAAMVGGIDTELGLTATEFLGDIELSALDLVRSTINAHGFGPLDLDLDLNVASILSTEAQLVVGEPPAESGWIALGEEGVTLHRAAARLGLGVTLDANLLGALGTGVEATSLRLPLTLELAGATATLDEITCAGSAASDIVASFLVGPTPLHPANGTSVAALYLGELPAGTSGGDLVNPDRLDFADMLTLRIVIPLPLLPDLTIADLVIQARSRVTIGTSAVDRIDYTRSDVAARDTVRSFGSEQLVSSAVDGLLSPSNTELRIKPGQEGLVSGLAAPVVNAVLALLPDRLLSTLSLPVDAVLDATLAQLGITLGAGELTLTGHHCELIRMVQ